VYTKTDATVVRTSLKQKLGHMPDPKVLVADAPTRIKKIPYVEAFLSGSHEPSPSSPPPRRPTLFGTGRKMIYGDIEFFMVPINNYN
jgi:hypothetical protein